jgi:hypothetical protein
MLRRDTDLVIGVAAQCKHAVAYAVAAV